MSYRLLNKILILVLLESLHQPEWSHEIHVECFVLEVVDVAGDAVVRQDLIQSISSTIYGKLLHAQIPKAQKDTDNLAEFLRFGICSPESFI